MKISISFTVEITKVPYSIVSDFYGSKDETKKQINIHTMAVYGIISLIIVSSSSIYIINLFDVRNYF